MTPPPPSRFRVKLLQFCTINLSGNGNMMCVRPPNTPLHLNLVITPVKIILMFNFTALTIAVKRRILDLAKHVQLWCVRGLVSFLQFKTREKHPWRMLILVKLQAKACKFTKIITLPWMFFTFFKPNRAKRHNWAFSEKKAAS